MNLEVIDGYKQIVEYIGFNTSFHDDYIESVEIVDGEIKLLISMRDKQKNKKVRIIFHEVKDYVLQGSVPSSLASIILDFEIQKNENSIIANIPTSYGTECEIEANKITMELVE